MPKTYGVGRLSRRSQRSARRSRRSRRSARSAKRTRRVKSMRRTLRRMKRSRRSARRGSRARRHYSFGGGEGVGGGGGGGGDGGDVYQLYNGYDSTSFYGYLSASPTARNTERYPNDWDKVSIRKNGLPVAISELHTGGANGVFTDRTRTWLKDGGSYFKLPAGTFDLRLRLVDGAELKFPVVVSSVED